MYGAVNGCCNRYYVNDKPTQTRFVCFLNPLRSAYKMAIFLYTFLALLLSSAAVGFARDLCTREQLELNLRKLATANNDLALNIYRQLAKGSSGNIFFSPLSLSTAFGMLYYGTKGNTAMELRNALGYETAGLQEDSVHQTFQQYLTESLPSQDPLAYILNSANAILLDKHLDLVPSYKREVQELYQAKVRDVDFAKHAPEITNEINSWVKEKTNGKIEKLLDDLDATTVLVLLNAVYFKGTWKTEFDSRETLPYIFYNNGLQSAAKKVPMMGMTEQFPYTRIDGAQALEIPYKGENISMVILLPVERDGLGSLETSLSLEKLSTIRYQLANTKVHLTMPKFNLQFSKEMSGDFRSVGAKTIFLPGADFSGMTSTPNTYVTQVLHKAVIEVNEKGSEAAAITGLISRKGNLREAFFVVNHPFLFAIVDRRNDMILFLGRVTTL